MSKETDKNPESIGQYVDITTLSEWSENPRYNEKAIDQVANSIQRFGFGSPIIVRKADNTIIAGHTRYQASLKLGLTQVPVRYMDLSPTEAELYAIADNKIGELADWNNEKLSEIIQKHNMSDVDVTKLGFTDFELDMLLSDAVDDMSEIDEWTDMPEFINDDDEPFKSIKVHFETEEDMAEFARLIGQNITESTTYLYHPKKEHHPNKDLRY